jgi:KaiC/GvpD/RAD55 family RecA-like ATPase
MIETYERFQLLTIDYLRRQPEPEWLIEGFIHKGDVAVIYGPPSSGKSFLALDWALSLAAGLPWLGQHAVARSPTIYMAGEGASSIFKRVDAWMDARKVTDIPNAFFHLRPLPLRETAAIAEVEQTLAAYDHGIGDTGLYPGMIVVDTLSQFFSGGDEITPDMTQFVSNMRRIAQETGATVLIVHHTNAGGERERGHTSLRCNVEVMFKVTAIKREGCLAGLSLINDKQKDDPEAQPIIAVLEPSKRSLVITREACEADDLVPKRQPGPPRPPSKESMRAWLAGRMDGATWGEWRAGTQLERDIFKNRLKRMMKDGDIYKSGEGRYFLTPTTEDLAALDDEDDDDDHAY